MIGKYIRKIIKKTIKYVLEFIALFLNIKSRTVVCSYSYIYEIKRLYSVELKGNINTRILFKNFFGFSFIPKEYYDALEISKVESGIMDRSKKLYETKEILSSEIIKYAHALDKGLRMPYKREIFGREKSKELEKLLLIWNDKFPQQHPIYIWAKNILIEYWNDQKISKKSGVFCEGEHNA